MIINIGRSLVFSASFDKSDEQLFCSSVAATKCQLMLGLLSSKDQECQKMCKASKPYHVGTHWIALAEYSQMSTSMPGFQSIFQHFLHHFVMAKLATTSSIRVKEVYEPITGGLHLSNAIIQCTGSGLLYIHLSTCLRLADSSGSIMLNDATEMSMIAAELCKNLPFSISGNGKKGTHAFEIKSFASRYIIGNPP